MKDKISKQLKFLIVYYGLLQSLHLLVLIRAGLMLMQGASAPFPILPPPGGWQEQTMPFMFGLAGMDVIGIILGIIFSFKAIIKAKFQDGFTVEDFRTVIDNMKTTSSAKYLFNGICFGISFCIANKF